jgi:hypothetical protein
MVTCTIHPTFQSKTVAGLHPDKYTTERLEQPKRTTYLFCCYVLNAVQRRKQSPSLLHNTTTMQGQAHTSLAPILLLGCGF